MSGCWLWMRDTAIKGPYGRLTFKGSRIIAHRYSYAIHKNEPSPANHIHHKCENTMCVNPDHLMEVTPQEHAKITAASNRSNICPKGHPIPEKSGRANGYRYCLVCSSERSRKWKKSRAENGWDKSKPVKPIGQAMKTHCPKGHEYNESNTRWFHGKSGSCRICIACKLELDSRNRTALRKKCEVPIPPGKKCKAGHELNEDNAFAAGRNHSAFGCWVCRDLNFQKRIEAQSARTN